jgi:flavin-dependent dehydrogenase
MKKATVVIIGGGLAGLVSAIDLRLKNHQVVLLEKNDFPKHKVCGEYISNEILSYLQSLQIDINSLKPSNITKLHFSLKSGKSLHTNLPLGGFGVSRKLLDNYLFQYAKQLGCMVYKDTVTDVQYENDQFLVQTNGETFSADIVLGAFGKRSNLDNKLSRVFSRKNEDIWLGVKAHYRVDFPDNLVGLHHFEGGYCGVSRIEDGLVNICYLATDTSFKQFPSLNDYQKIWVEKNPILKTIFQQAICQFEKPITISQVSFVKKKCVENHMLIIGDAAGLIHPLCGNGMAMAMHSAKIASEQVHNFLNGNCTRETMEQRYKSEWNKNFKSRLLMGRILGYVLQKTKVANFLLQIFAFFPFLLPLIIKQTHGKTV